MKGDKENYVKTLTEVLEAGDTMPEQRLQNTIAKRRAKRYMGKERLKACGFGAFFDHGELQKVESWWREHDGARPDASTLVTRAYQVARETTEPIPCPACGDETITREWGIGTLVMADVCLGCRGVWLDPGELDALFGAA
jgi:predicted RNA-binding Zn-ribbon protein involved in translation (DUF1610 family)